MDESNKHSDVANDDEATQTSSDKDNPCSDNTAQDQTDSLPAPDPQTTISDQIGQADTKSVQTPDANCEEYTSPQQEQSGSVPSQSFDADSSESSSSTSEQEQPHPGPIDTWIRDHKIITAIIALILFIVLLFSTHIVCLHAWSDATCTEPQTCSICNRTQGEALGHDWKAATCTEPKTCARCGETEGTVLGHSVSSWTTTTEPTCSKQGSRQGLCDRCGDTVTESIACTPHTEGDWQIISNSTVSSTGSVTSGVKAQYCTVCGKQLATESYSIEVTASQKNALRTAASYLNYTAFSHSGLVDQLEYEGYSTEDATFAADNCGADWNAQAYKKAEQYLDFMSFSKSGLISQLEYEGFTAEQAQYGADKAYGE